MCVVAAVRALRLRGTEKCPFDFATDGDSAGSENNHKKPRAPLVIRRLCATRDRNQSHRTVPVDNPLDSPASLLQLSVSAAS